MGPKSDESSSPPSGDCQWVAVHDRKLPLGAFLGGLNDKKEPMYVARMRHGGECLPGYVLGSSGICVSTWDGLVHRKENYEVLIATFAHEFEWDDSSNGEIVPGAVRGGLGSNDELLYIGRVKHGDGHLIGKIHPSRRACFVGVEDRERTFSKYDVLVCCYPPHY